MPQLPGELAIQPREPQPNMRLVRVNPAPPADVGPGVEAIGRSVEGLSNDIFRAQQQTDAVRAEDAFNQLRQKQIDLTYGDQGYTHLKGGNAVNRPLLRDYGTEFDNTAAELASGLGNDNQRRMFAQRAAIAGLQLREGIMAHVAQEDTSYAKSTLQGTIDTESQVAAANWSKPEILLASAARVNNAIDAYAQRPDAGIAPEEVQALKDKAQAGIFHAAVTQALSLSPDLGRAMFDVYKDRLKGEQRATLENQVRTREIQEMNASLTAVMRQQAMDTRDLHTTQTGNFSRLFAATMSPSKDSPAPTDQQLADAVRTQQITPEQSNAIVAVRRRGAAEDRADAVVALHTLLNDDSTSIKEKTDAVARAAHAGTITASTAGTLTDSIYNKSNRGESAAAKSAKAVVLAAAGVPEGMINFGNDDKVKRAAVLMEWDRRVTNGGEDPVQVRDEMVQKYQPQGVPPLTWEQPRYGAIIHENDLRDVVSKTDAAHDLGELKDADYQAQKAVIKRYAQFFDIQRRAREAAALARGKPSQQPKTGAVVRQTPRNQPVSADVGVGQ